MSLTAKQLAVIGIRLLAILVVVQTLAELPQTFVARSAWFAEYGMLFAGSIATLFFVAAVLWAVAQPLARVMVGTTEPEPSPPSATSEDLQVVAISIAGLLIVVVTLPTLIGQVIGLYVSSEVVSDIGVDRRVFTTGWLIGLGSTSLKLLLGFVLITTPRFWVRLLRQVREFGLPKENSSPGPPRGS